MDCAGARTFLSGALACLADSRRAAGMAAYMKTDMPFYGVPAPARRRLAAEVLRCFAPSGHAGYVELVRALWDLPHREEKYVAIDVAAACRAQHVPQSIRLYESMIREGAWWDLVDGIATGCFGRVLMGHRAAVTPVVKAWMSDPCMWIRRAALICQVGHRRETDGEMLFQACLTLAGEKEFFVRKAIGWALRDYSYTSPGEVAGFLAGHADALSGLSFREGAKALVRMGYCIR
jgi:3-methyladenine DNA glycosylase AlkD